MQSHLTLLISLLLPSAFALPNPASHSRITAESIFDLSHDSSRFIREAGDKNEPTTSTDQCPETKYEAFFDRYDNCMNAAQSIIDEALQDDFADIENAMCRSTEGQVNCMDTIIPECFNKEKYTNIRTNYITKKLESAYNITFLGQSYIDSCPILSREEPKIVRKFTGSNKCDFTTFEDNWRAYKSCDADAERKIGTMMALINADVFPDVAAAYIKAQCDYANSLYFTCEKDTIFKCYSDDKISEVNTNDVASMAQREALLRTQLEDFSYDICPWYKSNNSNGGFGDVEFVERSQKFRSANRNGEN